MSLMLTFQSINQVEIASAPYADFHSCDGGDFVPTEPAMVRAGVNARAEAKSVMRF